MVSRTNWVLRELALERIRLDDTQPRVCFPETERQELAASLVLNQANPSCAIEV